MRFLAAACLLALAACGVDTSTLSQPDLVMRDLSMAQPMECANGFTDGEETDQDCGGPTCAPCADGKSCKMGRDCASTFCTNNICDAASCMDGVKNGNESSQDCGGSCAGCAVGRACNAASDCQTMRCTNGLCAWPPCLNMRFDGDETDLDCGGGTCPACDDGKRCQAKTDCKSGTCTNNVCKSPLMCMAGTADCDGDAGNGCEVNTDSDAKNCGRCAFSCAANTPNCVGGSCKGQVEAKLGFSVPFPKMGLWTTGIVFCLPVTVGKPSTLIRLGVVAGPIGTQVKFGLYSDKNGSPASLIVSSAPGALTGGALEVAVNATPLPVGTYWVTSVFDSNAQVGYDANGMKIDTFGFQSQFANPLPQMWPPMSGPSPVGPSNFWMVVLQ